MMKSPILYIVVPCYNEEEVLKDTPQILLEFLTNNIKQNRVSKDSKILFVDDGSHDRTWDCIVSLNKDNPAFQGLKLAHNKGHQTALYAGLMEAKQHCDLSISIDADLQDDIHVMEEMLNKASEGCNVVFGVRNDRSTDTVFKKSTAGMYYKVLNGLGVKTIPQHADFRLLDRSALEALSEYKESNLFLRGIVTDIGLRTDKVYYSRKPRSAGESKYTLKKMLSLAEDGVTSFSISPLRWPIGLGLTTNGLGFAFLASAMKNKNEIHSLMSLMLFLSGMQFICTGIMGDYIGKMYFETKSRPRYIIEEKTNY